MNFHSVGEGRFYAVVNLVVCEAIMATELERENLETRILEADRFHWHRLRGVPKQAGEGNRKRMMAVRYTYQKKS